MYNYEHGGAIRYKDKAALDFSASINPLGLPEGVGDAIMGAVQECTAYPDSFSFLLRGKISEFESVAQENILCSSGASDLIFRLAYTLRPQKALVLAPTFSDYERALTAAGCKVYRHLLYEEDGFGLKDDILPLIKAECFDLIYICNPNNPTGCIISRDMMHKIIALCESIGCFIAVDECFMDFVVGKEQYTVKPLLLQYKNLIIIKAFTKIFALAGLRLGYGMCSDAELLGRLYACFPDWSVSALAQAAGLAALQNPVSYLKETLRYVETEKKKLLLELKQLGFTCFGSKANYIFFKSPYLFCLGNELLDKHKIFIRSCGNYHGLDQRFYRIGILPTEQNNRLIDSLRNITIIGGGLWQK